MAADSKQLRATYGLLFSEIEEILFRHDPVGINYETNADEYEPEVGTILPRLHSASSQEETLQIIHQEFVKWFGEDVAGSQENYRDIANEIWLVWQKFKAEN